MINFSAVFARKHGAPEGYAVLATFGDPHPVRARYAEILSTDAGFRLAHAETRLIIANVTVSEHFFPDPVALEAARKKEVLREALAKTAAAEKAAKALADAKAAADAAKASVKTLTDEEKTLLDAHTAAQSAPQRAVATKAAEVAKASDADKARNAQTAAAQSAAATASAEQGSASLVSALPPALKFGAE